MSLRYSKREITDQESQFLWKILDKPDEPPTDEEYIQAFHIFSALEFYTVQPRSGSVKYNWTEVARGRHLLTDSRSVFIFTNVSDMYVFQTEMLQWEPDKIEKAAVEKWTFMDATIAAERLGRLVMVDYQPDGERGFFVFNPKEDSCFVAVRE